MMRPPLYLSHPSNCLHYYILPQFMSTSPPSTRSGVADAAQSEKLLRSLPSFLDKVTSGELPEPKGDWLNTVSANTSLTSLALALAGGRFIRDYLLPGTYLLSDSFAGSSATNDPK